MKPDDHVCLCFRVSQRKLVAYMKREKPIVASQLADCLGAGTGCQWCVPFLKKLHGQWQRGEEPQLEVAPTEYAQRRKRYHKTGTREGIDDENDARDTRTGDGDRASERNSERESGSGSESDKDREPPAERAE